MLTLQQPLYHIGLVCGLLVNLALNFLTVYGLDLYNYLADQVEKNNSQRVTSIQGTLKL